MSKILDAIREWHDNDNADSWSVIKRIEQIEFDRVMGSKPSPQTYRYEKVTESIFDLKGEFERGELFDKSSGGEYYGISTEGWLVEARAKGGILRKVEIDPVEELARKLAVFGGEEDCAFASLKQNLLSILKWHSM